MRGWWDTRGRRQAEEYGAGRTDRLFDQSALCGFVSRLWDVVRAVLLPQAAGRSRLPPGVLQLIREVGAAGLPVATVLPATLRAQPGDRDAVATALRRQSAGARYEFRLSALRGGVLWADAHQPGRSRNDLPPLPPDLLREFGATVALRRLGGLRLVLDGSAAVVRRHRRAADIRFPRQPECSRSAANCFSLSVVRQRLRCQASVSPPPAAKPLTVGRLDPAAAPPTPPVGPSRGLKRPFSPDVCSVGVSPRRVPTQNADTMSAEGGPPVTPRPGHTGDSTTGPGW